MPPMNQRPNNKRSRTTGKLELRKLWNVPDAKFFWALFIEVEVQTAEMVKDKEGKLVPDFDKIIDTEIGWNCPQGYMGDEEWAKRTADHFGLEVPTEEYKDPEEKK